MTSTDAEDFLKRRRFLEPVRTRGLTDRAVRALVKSNYISTMKKTPIVARGAVINGGRATDFCARFLDSGDQPRKGFTFHAGPVRK